MPIITQIDSSLGVVFSTLQGVVTPEDILVQVESFKNDPAFQRSFNHLIDTRGTTRFDVSFADMRGVSSYSAFNEKSRRAVVVGKSEMYGDSPSDPLRLDGYSDAPFILGLRVLASTPKLT